ncbi:hypothetical protein MTQ00_21790 [Chryseobacterium sp. B21-037]|uniref:hypothetical protein n=1 Tax=Chryseobacterium sp. B21-037 TaxID=2926038 RepID=UPI00235962CF|nr:hypothetical protein [Chryseobacterium sp. B21-037]MDC8107124.1 hypothetical protein [Chryseobacterium sp. B21-037]
MELKQLNKVLILLAIVVNLNAFSQMKMADIENKQFSINLKTQKQNLIKIFDDNNYSIYYLLDRRNFDLKLHSDIKDKANIIFFSKKYNKGIITVFPQSVNHKQKDIYNITLYTGSADNYMFVPSMIIVDKDFNYEYLTKYSYLHLPYDINTYKSSISIQDNKNRCNIIHIDLKGNAVYENIDDILSNISKIPKEDSSGKECNSIIYEIDLKDFFPKKIIK